MNPVSRKAIAQPGENARPARQQNARRKITIDWGKNPGQSIVLRRAAQERKPQPDMAKAGRQREGLENSLDANESTFTPP